MHLIRSKYLLPIAAATLVLAACGGSSNGSQASPSTTPQAADSSKTATFVLDEWSIAPPKGNLAAGKVDINATNNGSETHELVIVRAEDASSLPVKTDGSVDEDKISESKKAGEIADLAPGKSATKSLDLSPGNYVAFCNIVDTMDSGMGSGAMGGGGMNTTTMGNGMHHVHYKQGMVNFFTVA